MIYWDKPMYISKGVLKMNRARPKQIIIRASEEKFNYIKSENRFINLPPFGWFYRLP
jgi:hypothetical protein